MEKVLSALGFYSLFTSQLNNNTEDWGGLCLLTNIMESAATVLVEFKAAVEYFIRIPQQHLFLGMIKWFQLFHDELFFFSNHCVDRGLYLLIIERLS